MEKGEK